MESMTAGTQPIGCLSLIHRRSLLDDHEAEKTRQADPVVESVGTETMNTTPNTTPQVGETPRAEETPLDRRYLRGLVRNGIIARLSSVEVNLNELRKANQLIHEQAAEITALRQQVQALQGELSAIDSVLARRPAMDLPTRRENIEKAISYAKRTDEAERLVKARDEQIARLEAAGDTEQRAAFEAGYREGYEARRSMRPDPDAAEAYTRYQQSRTGEKP